MTSRVGSHPCMSPSHPFQTQVLLFKHQLFVTIRSNYRICCESIPHVNWMGHGLFRDGLGAFGKPQRQITECSIYVWIPKVAEDRMGIVGGVFPHMTPTEEDRH